MVRKYSFQIYTSTIVHTFEDDVFVCSRPSNLGEVSAGPLTTAGASDLTSWSRAVDLDPTYNDTSIEGIKKLAIAVSKSTVI
jgi:hypothetical protein